MERMHSENLQFLQSGVHIALDTATLLCRVNTLTWVVSDIYLAKNKWRTEMKLIPLEEELQKSFVNMGEVTKITHWTVKLMNIGLSPRFTDVNNCAPSGYLWSYITSAARHKKCLKLFQLCFFSSVSRT